MIKDTKFVVIGGGTGTFSVLNGLKKYTENITAIVSMADSGGSAKKERDEFGMLPSSDIRKSLIALAEVSTEDSILLRQLFQYRYETGEGVKGITFGNLFLVALTKILGSQAAAIEKAGDLLNIRGKVLPVSLDPVDLVAEYEDGTRVVGEHYIDEPEHNGTVHITKFYTEPAAKVTPHVLDAIRQADVIIIGPGGFYTTILANLVVDGVRQAIIESNAKKIFILNLMTEYGQTYDFTASQFIEKLEQYLPSETLDYVIMNNTPIPEDILKRYEEYHAEPVINDFGLGVPFRVIEKDLVSDEIVKKELGDTLRRSLVRHDPEKIVRVCMEILNLV